MPQLTAKALCAKLGVRARELTQWVREGLPCTGRGRKRRFDPAAVAAWLQQTGRAQAEAPAPQVVTTRAEAAVLLGVNIRTLGQYLTDPTFPGKAGSPGRQDGYFPVEEMRAWKAAMHGTDHRSSSETTQEVAAAKLRRLQIETDRDHFEFERDLGGILDFEETARLQERLAATAKSHLDQLADLVDARLPNKISPRLRRIIRRAIAYGVARACDSIADDLAGDTDETEDLQDEPPKQ